MSQPVSVYLRRLQKEDITEVVEIEREAFSPAWVTSPFRRDINNKRACYLVACLEQEEEGQPVSSPSDGGDSSQSWISKLAGRLGLGGDSPEETSPVACAIAGYVSVWYQGDEAHITEIAVRETLRGKGIGELPAHWLSQGCPGIRIPRDDPRRPASPISSPSGFMKNTASSRWASEKHTTRTTARMR